MAYKISGRRSLARGRRPGGRSTRRPRRYTAKKRTYRKRKMTKRKLINVMSRKKRDSMLSGAFDGLNPSPESPVTGGIALQMNQTNANGRVHMTFANVSHRYLVPNNAAYRAYRTDTRTYVKGFSQTYTIVPTSSSCWWHRRIMFASKELFTTVEVQQSIGAQSFQGDSATVLRMRDLGNITEGPYNDLRNAVLDRLFSGTGGIDWISPFRAKTDKTRVTVLSDRSFNYSSGNEVSKPVIRKVYDAINRTVVYDDDEDGLSMTPSPLSVDSKSGLGNIYLVDFFFCPAPDDPDDALNVSSQATYYWHEK